MPTKDEYFGPFSAVYVGDCSPSVNVLQKVTETRTDGSQFVHITPERFVPRLRNSAQSAAVTLDFSLTFYGFEDMIMKLAMGNSVEDLGVERDDSSSFTKYTLLLLDEDPDSTRSVLVPECYTFKRYDAARSKQALGKLKIDFHWEERNRFLQLYRQSTYATLATLLGARSPI